MGCGSSTAVTTLTDIDKTLLRESWQEFNEGDIVENGAHMYLRLFSKYPETKTLFSFNKDEVISEDNYKTNSQFCRHVKKVFVDTLGTAINGMDDLPALAPTLKDLGGRHTGYGVTMKHYGILGQCLVYSLEHKLGSNFTKAKKQAWVNFFSVIAANMREGMEEQRKREENEAKPT
ncbi:neuroglobin-like [Gigantopelta aegis]|uniref:neuroglobin-like n=1 Tax=Gigantopelta aegis TaxID=1735272 RepID=UPI001B88D853|nr:neuroglobin-like [Gigantopelta aegis]